MKQKTYIWIAFSVTFFIMLSSCSPETAGYTTYDGDSEQDSSSEAGYKDQDSYCNEGCLKDWIGDGFCDTFCNVESCNYDGEDCIEESSSTNTIDISLEVIEPEEDLNLVENFVCTPRYLEEYQCRLDYIYKKYQSTDCTTRWDISEYCPYGCDSTTNTCKSASYNSQNANSYQSSSSSSSGYICSYNAYNCRDFSYHSQAEAQYVFEGCYNLGYGDVHHLDEDNDGKACESLA